MNRAEYEQKLKHLQAELEELKKVKIKEDIYDDKIFLLSEEEYKEYKNKIPCVNCWWWLRSPGSCSKSITYVHSDGSTDRFGNDVYDDGGAVRPVLKYDVLTLGHWKDGQRIWLYNFPWIVIDSEKQIAIAEVPIGFVKFDNKSENYETSYVRQWIKEWKESR